jgi:Xaa-Pro aminopeptidase
MARTVPDTLAFGRLEYEERLRRLRASMTASGVDVLLVTSPVNLCYLTGYVASWYAPRLPTGALIHREAPEVVIVDWSRHADYVPLIALHDELELVDYGSAPSEVVAALRRRGWLDGTVGLDWSAPNPVAGVLRDISAGIAALGGDVVSGDHLVDDLRIYKSPAELERIRRAGEIADDAFAALRSRIRPGLTELEVAALITSLLAERGSEVPAQHALVSSGPTAWADVHAFPSRREIERGEIVSVDACAVIDRYHVNLSRVFAMGGVHARAEEYLAAGAESLAVLCREARIGESPAPAMAAAERALRERVPAENVWWVGGYGLGLAFPPSWVGHTYLADDGPRRAALGPGYVSNFETVLYDRIAGFEAAAIDTLVATENGLAPVSRIPRELLRV